MTREYKVGGHRKIKDYEKVRSLYAKGMTCDELGEKYGVTRSRIAQIVHDIVRPWARRPIEKAKVQANMAAAVKAIRAGESAKSMCQRMKLSLTQFMREVSVRKIRPPQHTIHGTVQCYNRGCRCDECHTKYSTYRKDLVKAQQARKKGTKQ